MEPGQEVGRVGQLIKDTYRLTRIIGKGGMGEVYEAEHVALPRRFAVKFLLGDLGLGSEVLARFHREASIAASVGSEHIVEVFDYGQASDGSYFMVMELLEGDTLTERIATQGALTPEAWLPILEQITDGLEAAHSAGVVHRDLKPDNIFLSRNRRGKEVLKILDFGISKIRMAGVGVTQAGAVMGTPSYMPPEQAEGSTASTDARADIFSLGTIMYEALSGRVAFAAPTVPAVIVKVCYQEPEPLEVVAPHVPPQVVAVVMRALRKSPAERYQSVRELLDAYRAALATAEAPGLAATPGLAGAPALPGAGTMNPGSATPQSAAGLQSATASAPTGLQATQDGTTLSSAASELQPPELPALPTPTHEPGRKKKPGLAVAMVGIVVLTGLTIGFLAMRSSGDVTKSPPAGKATKPPDPGPPAADTTARPPPTMEAPPAVALPPATRLPPTPPRRARPTMEPPSGSPGNEAMTPGKGATPPGPRRTAQTERRPPPRRRGQMAPVSPRRRASMRRRRPRPPRRRATGWAR